MDGFKKIIGFVIGFAIVFGVIHGFGGGEKLKPLEEFNSPEGRFSVMLPGKPEKKPQTAHTVAGPITMVMYIAGTEESAFAISYADYPATVIQNSNFKEMLDGSTQGAAANAGARIVEHFDSNYRGKPGREVRMEATKGGKTATLRAWHIIVGNRLYQLMVASPSDEVVNQMATEFFDSLIIEGIR